MFAWRLMFIPYYSENFYSPEAKIGNQIIRIFGWRVAVIQRFPAWPTESLVRSINQAPPEAKEARKAGKHGKA